MNTDLATLIKKNNYHCLFLSPHADDVILSCGSLLSRLVGKTDITVLTVFTKAHEKPYTLSAKQFMKYSNNFADAQALYDVRVEEDKNAFARLGITPINLGFEDALFRRKKHRTFLGKFLPEFDHIYPTYRWHILKKIASDDSAISELTKQLPTYVKKNTLVFAPFGLGNHADHKVVRLVSEKLFDNLILYSDFPYNIRLNTYGQTPKAYTRYEVPVDKKKKDKLLHLYETQYRGLFPVGTTPDHKEVFFVKNTNALTEVKGKK